MKQGGFFVIKWLQKGGRGEQGKRDFGEYELKANSKELLEWYIEDCELSEKSWKSSIKIILNDNVYAQ